MLKNKKYLLLYLLLKNSLPCIYNLISLIYITLCKISSNLSYNYYGIKVLIFLELLSNIYIISSHNFIFF